MTSQHAARFCWRVSVLLATEPGVSVSRRVASSAVARALENHQRGQTKEWLGLSHQPGADGHHLLPHVCGDPPDWDKMRQVAQNGRPEPEKGLMSRSQERACSTTLWPQFIAAFLPPSWTPGVSGKLELPNVPWAPWVLSLVIPAVSPSGMNSANPAGAPNPLVPQNPSINCSPVDFSLQALTVTSGLALNAA